MLLDANLLLYAVHKQSEQHEAAADWLTGRAASACLGRASLRFCESPRTRAPSSGPCLQSPPGSG
jgi:hypothetical protein